MISNLSYNCFMLYSKIKDVLTKEKHFYAKSIALPDLAQTYTKENLDKISEILSIEFNKNLKIYYALDSLLIFDNSKDIINCASSDTINKILVPTTLNYNNLLIPSSLSYSDYSLNKNGASVVRLC